MINELDLKYAYFKEEDPIKRMLKYEIYVRKEKKNPFVELNNYFLIKENQEVYMCNRFLRIYKALVRGENIELWQSFSGTEIERLNWLLSDDIYNQYQVNQNKVLQEYALLCNSVGNYIVYPKNAQFYINKDINEESQISELNNFYKAQEEYFWGIFGQTLECINYNYEKNSELIKYLNGNNFEDFLNNNHLEEFYQQKDLFNWLPFRLNINDVEDKIKILNDLMKKRTNDLIKK